MDENMKYNELLENISKIERLGDDFQDCLIRK